MLSNKQNSVPPFQSLHTGTVEQASERDKMVNLKSLAKLTTSRLKRSIVVKAKPKHDVDKYELYVEQDNLAHSNESYLATTILQHVNYHHSCKPPPLDMAAIRYDFEERIAIMMYDGGMPQREATNAALEGILQNLSTYTL